MSLQAVEAPSTRTQFDIRRTQRSMISALLEARKIFGGKTVAIWDADDRQLTYDEIVRAAFALGSAMRKYAKPKESVGIMLPTGAGAVLAFYAIHAFGRVPAMLNFTSGARNLKAACAAALSPASSRSYAINTRWVLNFRKAAQWSGVNPFTP